MGRLPSNLHVAQIWTYLTHPFLVLCFCGLLSTNGTLMHFNSVHLQLTCNQHNKTPEPTSSLSVIPLKHSTLVPNLFTKDLDTLTLNESHTEHIRKGHQRHGHPHLAIHTTTRSQSTQQWIHNPHTPTEILSKILFKGSSCIWNQFWPYIWFFPINNIISLSSRWFRQNLRCVTGSGRNENHQDGRSDHMPGPRTRIDNH